MSLRFSAVGFLLTVALLAAGPGCSKKDSSKATISGRVTYKGTPLGGGNMTLHPAGTGNPYPVSLKPDGTFQIGEVPPGEMKVAIETETVKAATAGYAFKPPPEAAQKKDAKLPDLAGSRLPTYVKIPAKYANPQTSGLTWTIEAGRNNEKTFDLTD